MKRIIASKRERGQSLVELAISVTFLLILLAGAVDLGRAFFEYIAMRDAAQEGLVYASLYPDRCELINYRVDANIDNVTPDAIEIQYQYGGSWHDCATASLSQICALTPIRISVVQNDFPITIPFLGTFIGSQEITMRATVFGSALRPKCP